MSNLLPIQGPERDLDFTGKTYYREHLPDGANDGDTCTLAYSGGSGWYNQSYRYISGEWQVTNDTRPWQMDAWNIGQSILSLRGE